MVHWTTRGLEQLKGSLGEAFGTPVRAQVVQVSGSLSGTSSPSWLSQSFFQGWDYGEQDPNWLLRVHRNQLTLHQVRAGHGLPEGEYLGWDSIFERFSRIHGAALPQYGILRPRRVGVRYVNRVVLPAGSDLRTWFSVVPDPPPQVMDVRAFDLAHTWSVVEEDERFRCHHTPRENRTFFRSCS